MRTSRHGAGGTRVRRRHLYQPCYARRVSFGEPWSDNEDEALRIRFHRGESDGEIAYALVRRSTNAVCMRRIGMKLSRSAEWSEKRTEQLRALFDDGYQDTEIAVELKTTERAVANRRCRIGLRRYRRDTRPPRPDSASTIETLREGLDLVITMLRAGTYSHREIVQEAQEALAPPSSPRSLSVSA